MNALFILGACSFGVQQLVEIVGDPFCTYFVRRCLSAQVSGITPPTLLGFTESEIRTIVNNAISCLIGILLAVLVPEMRVLKGFSVIGASDRLKLLDVILTGVVVGAGTNGTNSILKLAQYAKQRVGILGGGTTPVTTGAATTLSAPALHPLITGSAEPVGINNAAITTLPVPYECQECTNWCWAAVGSMVAQRFGRQESQCEVATRVLTKIVGLDCCQQQQSPGTCNVADNSPCNRQADLEDALGDFYAGCRSDAIDAQEVDQTINLFQCPIGCHIDLVNPPGSHFVLLTGFVLNPSDPESSLVTVNDPDPAHGQWTDKLSQLRTYRGQGTWDYTYFTSQAS